MIVHEQQIEQRDRARFQTLQRSFEQICAGEDPWIPLGKFMHQFFGEFKEHREALLHDPLFLPPNKTPEQFRWAVFCAASANYLCHVYSLECPDWARDPYYTLDHAWYHGLGSDHLRGQEKLRATTPEEFSQRNIFCGNRIFYNKYEYQGRRRTA
ncbi:hypothetical protein [Dictyobacter formicarum]|uniref:Uncharacterized protein n=1 Tax=Dictyobacter formicarum TaxID=2778368 RepID=A0ABQ3VNZ4_9CHLR|nr:hypothetical protein [Dictyobacter formicarum]GHO87562.1 hypothetical protein KSZ_55680 [Dictyobacter formicarum]